MSTPNGKTSQKQTATKTGDDARLRIKEQTMRELLFASGGRCAMDGCGLPLTSPSGGWIGTVAHIVGAKKKAARGGGPETPKYRASFDNLMLMCATHGREVDAPETGEQQFPIDMLRAMKKTHETKISSAVKSAIEQELTGVRTADGVIDTGLRDSSAAATAAGLVEAAASPEPNAETEIINGLAEASLKLTGLSQLGLDTLAQLLALWVKDRWSISDGVKELSFGDPGGPRPRLSGQAVDNRVNVGKQDTFTSGMEELRFGGLVSYETDEYERRVDLVLENPWSVRLGRNGLHFWVLAAEFLYEAHQVLIHDWVRTLDFTIFDRVAAADRDVPWPRAKDADGHTN